MYYFIYLIMVSILLNIVYDINVHNKESMKMVESVNSNNNFSTAINNAVANQNSDKTPPPEATTTATNNPTAITPTQEKELKALGLNNNPSIKTNADAKKAIAKAQKVIAEKASEMSSNPAADTDDIKDIVQISNTAQKLTGSSGTEK